MPKRPVQHATGPGLPVKENPLKNTNLEWRGRVEKDPAFCKKSCCWTPYSCGRSYSCNCHQREIDK